MTSKADIKTHWHEAPGSQRLAEKLADDVASLLAAAIRLNGTALLIVSGGTTPLPFFNILSTKKLPWEHVTIVLADERFVPPDSPRSNEHLVTLDLLQNEAAKAHFEGLYEKAGTAEEAAVMSNKRISKLGFPADVAVLGMGLDGHTASLFPDWEDLQKGLEKSCQDHVLAVDAPSAQEPRLTLPLARLAESRKLILLIEGYEKKERLLGILDESRLSNAPIGAVFAASRSPVDIYWAPKNETSNEA